LGEKTTTEAHLELVRWAGRFGSDRRWAVEDCRHLSRRLEADLLAGGEEIVRVPPKMMAHARDAARAYGKSDPIVRELAPTLLAVRGVGELTAAKLVAETADVRRFRSKDAFARHNGTAPLPVWSANRARHRLSRTGNRQLNAAIHRIAVTQMRCHEPAKVYLERRMMNGNTKTEALRALKRKLSDVVYRALLADATSSLVVESEAA
jgi:transposase